MDNSSKPQEYYSTTITGTLMLHVRSMYLSAVKNFQPAYYPRKGINLGSSDGIPAYVIAVEAIESFLNETFMVLSRPYIKDAQLWRLSASESKDLDRLKLRDRIQRVPQLLIGKSLAIDDAAVKEFNLLIEVRNSLVHYKMQKEWHDFMGILLQRNIGLNALDPIGYDAWAESLNTSEGIRWANNTACELARELYGLLPDQYRLSAHQIENFIAIDESIVRAALAARGIDPSSTNIPGRKE